MSDKVKYFYFFKGTLKTHLQFYEAWLEIFRSKGIPIELLTILKLKNYIKEYNLIKKKKSSIFHIYPALVSESIFIFLYFSIFCLLYKKVIVIVKRRPIYYFDILKKIYRNKIVYIYEMEGDVIAERQFIEEHSKARIFFKKSIEELKKKQRKQLINADHIGVVSPRFKELMIERHKIPSLENKISILPVTFSEKKLYFSEDIRNEFRKNLNLENKFIIIYVGNVVCVWQNLYRTIEVFKLIKNKLMSNAYLIVLTRKDDFHIVLKFTDKLQLSRKDYLLSNVDYSEIPKYLNASDLGVMLRHKHLMNEILTIPGKTVDYLGCGLPVLTTNSINELTNKLHSKGFCCFLNDMDNDDEIIKKIKPFLKHDKNLRQKISKWANSNLCSKVVVKDFINVLKNV